MLSATQPPFHELNLIKSINTRFNYFLAQVNQVEEDPDDFDEPKVIL